MAMKRNRLRPGADDHAIRLGELALECAGLHVVFAAAIDQRDGLRAEPLLLHGDVNRRHAAADHHDVPADRQGGKVLSLSNVGDVVDRVDDIRQRPFVGEPELVGRPESDAEEHRVIVATQFIKLHILAKAAPCFTSTPPIDRTKAASFAAKSSTAL